MATFSSVQRRHVLQAIEEYDNRGEEDFLGIYGFALCAGYKLHYEGQEYDPKALLGVAHRYATGRVAIDDEFHGGLASVAMLLRKRGFDVVGPPVVTRDPAPRSAHRTAPTRATPVRRVAASDRPAPVCPTCFMTLPATGLCDQCS